MSGHEHMHDMPMTPPTPKSTDHMNNNSNHMDTMHMTLYWGKNAVVLFQGWPGQRLGMYILAIFSVFFLALGVEIFSLFYNSSKPSRLAGTVAQAGVYALKMALAYLLMLAVMSFNLGIFIAAVVGHTLGFIVVKLWTMRADSQQAEPKV